MKITSVGRKHTPSGRRPRIVAGALGAAVLVTMFVAPAAAANAASAAPAACTDGASTLTDITEYGTDIQLRASGSCGGSAWFRLNGWNGVGTGLVRIQFRTSSGSVVNGPAATLQQEPYISAYTTGYRYARITFTNEAGAEPNYTGPWEDIPIDAIAQQ